MIYSTISSKTKPKKGLVFYKIHYMQFKFDRSVLLAETEGTLFSFYSFFKEIIIYWKSENGRIKIYDSLTDKSFYIDVHAEYILKIIPNGKLYYLTISGFGKNKLRKIYINKRSYFQFFTKGPSIQKGEGKIYFIDGKR